jgi:hypothetical protein
LYGCIETIICTLRKFWNRPKNGKAMLKSFDTINGEQMWRILRLYGTPTKMTLMIKLFYNDHKARVEHRGINIKLDEMYFFGSVKLKKNLKYVFDILNEICG